MINTLRDIGTAVYDAFVFPGTFLVSRIVEHMPGLAAWLNINGGESTISKKDPSITVWPHG